MSRVSNQASIADFAHILRGHETVFHAPDLAMGVDEFVKKHMEVICGFLDKTPPLNATVLQPACKAVFRAGPEQCKDWSSKVAQRI